MKQIAIMTILCLFFMTTAVVKSLGPVMPVAPKIITPLQPPVGQSVVQPIQALSPQPIGTIAIENTSKIPVVLTGWKTKYKDSQGIIQYKNHSLKSGHTLKPLLKKQSGVTVNILNVSVNVPNNSFVEGISDLLVSGSAPISVEYKGRAWMPGITDKIYVKKSGTEVMLDLKAMDASYKKINSGLLHSSTVVKVVDDTSTKITDVTKAATVPLVQTGKEKFETLAKKMKKQKVSKSAQSSAKVLPVLSKV